MFVSCASTLVVARIRFDYDVDRLESLAIEIEVDIVDDTLDLEHPRVLQTVLGEDQDFARMRGHRELKLMQFVDDKALVIEKAVVVSRFRIHSYIPDL